MGIATPQSQSLRALIAERRDEIEAVLVRYGAKNPRLFGSVARGDADAQSDIDVLVDLDPADGNVLFRAGGLNEEFRRILGCDVDVFSPELLRESISEEANHDLVPI